MSYDPYSRICIPIHYAPVELKIGTQRGATDRARCMGRRRRAAAETINQRPPAPRVFLPAFASPLPFREAHANRTHLNGERCNGPGKERSIVQGTFRYFPYILSVRFECTNPYESLNEGRAHRCTKLRTNKSLWHDRRAQTQLCNASALGNSIYVTVVLLSTYVVL